MSSLQLEQSGVRQKKKSIINWDYSLFEIDASLESFALLIRFGK